MLPTVHSIWAATNRAAAAMDDELTHPLSATVREAIEALEARPFRDRVRDAELVAC